jgi:hypothetical protein
MYGMVAPRGTYTFWHWPAPARGADSLEWDLTVLRDPGATTYFWAHQWWFQRGDAAYFGLQAHDLRDDGSTGKLAVFSIWSAVGCADNPGCHGGVEGSGFWTCRLAYDWEAGRTYRLRVARRDTPGAGRRDSLWAGRGNPAWWSASITDQDSGIETLVGSIQVPHRWCGLDLVARGSSVWTEFYGANAPGGLAGPEQVPHATVRFGVPRANGSTVAPAAHANRLGDGDFDNSRVADDGEGVRHEMGIPAIPGIPGIPGIP